MVDETNIQQALVQGGYVSEADMTQAQQFTHQYGGSILDYLFEHNLLTRDLLGQAIAESARMQYADLVSFPPSREQVLRIPEKLATAQRVVLVKETPKQVALATDQLTKEVSSEISALFPGKKLILAYALTEALDQAFAYYRKQLSTRFAEIIKTQAHIAPTIIEQIIEDALVLRASDIHFEPLGAEVLIRFRIDGVLHEAGRVAKKYYENMVNRIKVQARLRIDEHQAAQDGAIRFNGHGRGADLRVSIVPTLEGEKIVIRLLTEYIQQLQLSGLGLSGMDQEILLKSAKKPFGMIVVTGPTGSGKTTTLYGLVGDLHGPETNITTIEDPVEYRIPGINQIQVNNQTNLTFAKGLRSIARQDPDIILVGEIRDLETAEIAVNAALTGHLLLSTFHANDAVSAIPRLLDMGIEPFLLSSTLDLIVAQRLARKICESCRVSQTVTAAQLQKTSPQAATYFGVKSLTLYQGKGCGACNDTGYKGRIGLYEMLNITPELEDFIVTQPSSKAIFDLARKQGFRTMWEDGLEKVKAGQTTLQELLRVVAPN